MASKEREPKTIGHTPEHHPHKTEKEQYGKGTPENWRDKCPESLVGAASRAFSSFGARGNGRRRRRSNANRNSPSERLGQHKNEESHEQRKTEELRSMANVDSVNTVTTERPNRYSQSTRDSSGSLQKEQGSSRKEQDERDGKLTTEKTKTKECQEQAAEQGRTSNNDCDRNSGKKEYATKSAAWSSGKTSQRETGQNSVSNGSRQELSKISNIAKEDPETQSHKTVTNANANEAEADVENGKQQQASRSKQNGDRRNKQQSRNGRKRQQAGRGQEETTASKDRPPKSENENRDNGKDRKQPANDTAQSHKHQPASDSNRQHTTGRRDPGQRHSQSDAREFFQGRKTGENSQRTDRKDNNKDRMVQRKSVPCKTNLFFRVRQTFPDMQSLISFLKETTKSSDITVGKNDVTDINGSTYVYYTYPSESKADEIQQRLQTGQSEPRVDCSLQPFLEYQLYKNKLSLINDAARHFDQRSRDFLESHDRKISDVNRKIREDKKELNKFYTHDYYKERIARNEDKIEELDRQKAEFITAKNDLVGLLHCAGDKTDCKGVVDRLKDRFHRECKRLDTALPVYARRSHILQLVKDNQVCVIKGETGSGKSTQLVQYLVESGVGGAGMTVCTQPRRVAATALASHVAKELGTFLGGLVGYKLGSKLESSVDTKILYTTDHSLLNDCLLDPDLSLFSCIVVDEAHERSLYTDLLLSMIKRCLPRRPDLRVIISSATIDPGVFQKYFDDCPVLQVSGRLFPVELNWANPEEELTLMDNICKLAVSKVINIHAGMREPPGDILVFVTSPLETEICCQMVQKEMSMRADFKCFQLYGQQPAEEQQKVFAPLDRGKRKIIFATNCAETSITIDGVRFVVDTGLAKEMTYDPRRNLNSLRVGIISQSSADQRKGRAGRTGPGKCFRLYSPQTYDGMRPISQPEILRINLGHALLKLAELGVERDGYDFVQAPSPESLDDAREMLTIVGALEEGKITEKGRWIASLPFDPRLGLLTFMGREKDILYDSVVLAAVMSAGGDLFYRGSSEENQRVHDVTKTKLSLDKGDSLTCLGVYKRWLRVQDREQNQWCVANGLNAKALRSVRETVNDVSRTLRDKGLLRQQFAQDDVTEDLRHMIFQCYSANLCHHLGQDKAGYFAARSNRRVHVHPSSCLNTLAYTPEWIVYDQMIQTSRDFITGVTPVDPAWISQLNQKTLGFDPQEVARMTLNQIFSRKVGSKAFWEIVGPSYIRLRKLEETFCSNPRLVVMVEVNRQLGDISVYATEETTVTAQLITELETSISETENKLLQQDREEVIAGAETQGKERNFDGIRAVLGNGGQIYDILMPDQTRKVFIRKKEPSDDESSDDASSGDESKYDGSDDDDEGDKNRKDPGKRTNGVNNSDREDDEIDDEEDDAEEIENTIDDTTDEEMKAKFSRYGDVSMIRNFGEKQRNFWGFLLFRTSQQAQTAVHETSRGSDHQAQLEYRTRAAEPRSSQTGEAEVVFKVDLTWCQRPCKGVAIIKVSPHYFDRFLELGKFSLKDASAGSPTISLTIRSDRRDKSGCSLEVLRVSDTTTEDALKQALLRALLGNHVDSDNWNYQEEEQEQEQECAGDSRLWCEMVDEERIPTEEARGGVDTEEAVGGAVGGSLGVREEGALGVGAIPKRIRRREGGRALGKKEIIHSVIIPRKECVWLPHRKYGTTNGSYHSSCERSRRSTSNRDPEEIIDAEDPVGGRHRDDDTKEDRRRNDDFTNVHERLLRSSIRNIFRNDVEKSPHVTLINPDPEDIFFQATVVFKNAFEGFGATYHRVEHDFDLRFNGIPLRCTEIMPCATSSFYIDPDEGSTPALTEAIKDVEDEYGVRVDKVDQEFFVEAPNTKKIHKKSKKKKKNYEKEEETTEENATEKVKQIKTLISVVGTTPSRVITGKILLENTLRGDVMVCNDHQALFTPAGAELLRELEAETGTTVTAIKRSRTIVIKGLKRNRAEMREKIAEQCQNILQFEDHHLKGGKNPPGLMKALILTYGEDLDGLIDATGLRKLSLDFRRHRLMVFGDETSLTNAKAAIQNLRETLDAGVRGDRETMEECSACLCPVDDGQLYRLELCAHPYCKVCFQQQVKVAVKERALPTHCCHIGCNKPLVLRDFYNLSRDNHLNLRDLSSAAVAAFIASRSDDYRSCPTPDCPAVYRTNQRPQRTNLGFSLTTSRAADIYSEFICPACSKSTCTHCHNPGHKDKRCDDGGGEEDDDDDDDDAVEAATGIRQWQAEDENNRKQCPRCSIWLEKIAGCNHVTCPGCKKHLCWKCLKVFPTDESCYNHLLLVHGGHTDHLDEEAAAPLQHPRLRARVEGLYGRRRLGENLRGRRVPFLY